MGGGAGAYAGAQGVCAAAAGVEVNPVAWPLELPPRRWQGEAFPVAVDEVRARKAPLIVAPCAAGKAYLIAALCAAALPHAQRTQSAIVVLAPRQSLVRQLVATLRSAGLPAGPFFADEHDATASIIVACNASAEALFGRPDSKDEPAIPAALTRSVSLLLCDEAHRTQPLVEAVLRVKPLGLVGVTATPYCGTGPLRLFSGIAYRYSARDAIKDGCIVDYDPRPWPSFEEQTAEEREQAMVEMCRSAEGPGMVFARSIADAEGFAARLCAAGVPAAAVHSDRTPKQNDAALLQLQRGELHAVCHRSILMEGTDHPWLRWGLLRRPSMSAIEVVQGPGRLARAYPGKTSALIFDPYNLLRARDCPPGVSLHDFLADRAAAEEEAAQPRAKKPPPLPPFVAVEAATTWCMRLLGALVDAGYCEAVPVQCNGGWPTHADLRRLHALCWHARYLPKEAREPAKALWSAAVCNTWAGRTPRYNPEAVYSCPFGAAAVAALTAVFSAAEEASREVRQNGARRGVKLLVELPPDAVPSLHPGALLGLAGAVRDSLQGRAAK